MVGPPLTDFREDGLRSVDLVSRVICEQRDTAVSEHPAQADRSCWVEANDPPQLQKDGFANS